MDPSVDVATDLVADLVVVPVVVPELEFAVVVVGVVNVADET